MGPLFFGNSSSAFLSRRYYVTYYGLLFVALPFSFVRSHAPEKMWRSEKMWRVAIVIVVLLLAVHVIALWIADAWARWLFGFGVTAVCGALWLGVLISECCNQTLPANHYGQARAQNFRQLAFGNTLVSTLS